MYTPDEINACQAAMSKPAPIEALMLLASGRVVAHISDDGRQVFLDTLDGQKIRDRGHKMSIAGAWPLYIAGMIDENCALTDAGHATLASAAGEPA